MTLTLSLAAVIVALAGCATTGPAPGEQPTVKITSIDTREADGKTEIIVGGDQPISQYTSFQLTEPLRLVVDMTDVNLGQFQDRMVVNKGPIADITPTQQDNIGRLEIALGQQVETKVYQDGGRLVVELGRQIAAAPKAPAPAPPEPAPAEKAPEPLPVAAEPAVPKGLAATAVTAVKATATRDGVVVSVTGNGVMSPKVFAAEKGMKLVVDIPGVRNSARPLVIPVRKGGLDKVRIGQHTTPEKKVRIVLDLDRPMDFTSAADGNRLNIALLTAAAAPEQAAPAPAPAPEREVAAAPVAPPVPPARKERAAAPAEESLAESVDMITEAPRYTGRKISLDFQDADLVNILRLFAEMANFNMILSPDVRGKVTVRMVNVPWDQAMDIILKMNGLGYTKEDNILRIASLAALARESDDLAKAKEAKKKAEDLITRIIPVNYATASAVEGTIKKSLSARGETVVDARTNTLIVKDIARNVDEVATLIRLLDKPIPQVMIEARIVEATTSFTRDLGVQWGGKYTASAATGNPTGFTFPNSVSVTGGPTMGATVSGTGNYFVNLPAAAGSGAGGAIGFTFGSLNKALNLDLVLSALESTGEGKVISTPRVSALDNKEAKIEQGQSIPYQSTSSSGTQVQFIDAQLSLAVTPHVTPDNKIFMKIQAQKNAPDTSLLGAGGQPSIRKNQATTEILLADGETAVIGGILIIDRGTTIQRVPFFADLPLIGWLFKKKVTRDDKRELLIFITPRIIRQETV
jgi:type IV pilus assembly protein PilQ